MRKILVPEAGKSSTVLTVRKWLKAAGQAVAKGESLAQLESQDGLIELQAAESGVLSSIAVPAGKSAKVGALLAELDEAGSVAAVGDRGGSTPAVAAPTPAAPSINNQQSTAAAPPLTAGVTPILMPQAGNSMEEGTVVKWHVKEGDRITVGQVIFEIETDKANMEVEATEAGRVAKIVIPEGGVQKVKEPVAYLSEGDVNVASVATKTELPQKAPAAAGELHAQKQTPAVAAPSASAPFAPSVANSSAANVTPILMPQAGNSMEEGTVVKWRVKEGDRITVGQVLFEIETDKANMEVEATDAGRVAKIVIAEGGVQKVKEPVAYLSEGDVNVASAAVRAELPQKAPAAAGELHAQKQTVAAAASSASATFAPSVAISSEGRVKASPAARKIAQEKGLDLASVGAGSGPGGRILSTDLANAGSRAARPGAAAQTAACAATTSESTSTRTSTSIAPLGRIAATEIVRKKMTKMRKAIAANLLQSKQSIPHFYLRTTVNADAMMAFYKGEKTKYPCSVNDVVTLACAKAIVEFPALRSKLDKDEIVEYPAVNIGVAVGVEDGLTVPVLLNAHEMNLQQIAAGTKRIVENARGGKLEGYGQGNFTITNLGMFGVEEFAAIVNPPEPAILAVGAAREAVIVKDGFMKPGRVMTMTLSCDHRLVDGLLAAKFMARVKELLENPGVLNAG